MKQSNNQMFGRKYIEGRLDDVAQLILNQSRYVADNGLWFGKTGIAIFLFHYAKYTGNRIYEERAFDLIEIINKEIYSNFPLDYSSGLSGIGTGMAYLLQNKFIEADSDEFLEDFDGVISRSIAFRRHHISLATGLLGTGKYYVYRNKESDGIQYQKNAIMAIQLVDILREYSEPGLFPMALEGKLPPFETGNLLFFLNDVYRLYPEKIVGLIEHFFPYLSKDKIPVWLILRLLQNRELMNHSQKMRKNCEMLMEKIFAEKINNDVVNYFEEIKRSALKQICTKRYGFDIDNMKHPSIKVDKDQHGLYGGNSGTAMCLLTMLDLSVIDWFDLLDVL